MPELIELIAAVAVLTETLKALVRKFVVEITKALKVILASVSSVGVVAYYAIDTETIFNLDLVWIGAQVIAASVFGYKIAMKFRANSK